MNNSDIISSMDLGDKIKYFRMKAGLTQEELSNKLNYSDKDIISLFETNKKNPNIKVLADIANVLSINLSYFKLDNLSLGEKIKYMRIYSGFTQLELSEKLKISNTVLSNIENNHTPPSNDIIYLLAESFNMSVSELLNFTLESKKDQKTCIETGDKIRYYRKKAKLTQKELGEKIGISGSYISLFEINKRFPDNCILIQIANVLNQDIAKLS